MKTRKIKNANWKFPKIVFLIFLVFIFVLFIQLSYLSLSPTIYGINMDEFALNRNTISGILPASRGNIYDSSGTILAQNVSSYTVIAYLDESRTGNSKTPLHVVDKETTAKKLSEVLGKDEDDLLYLLKTFSEQGKYQVELAHGITEMNKEAIENLNLPGIDFVENYKRYYPNGDFASYVIGYAKTNENVETDEDGYTKVTYEIDGELGIEAKYNDLLKGKDGYLSYQSDRFGYKIPDTKETRIEATNGANIYLTLDSNIQRFLETAVKAVNSEYKPDWMMITVMDAKTGDILGTASTPSFDPNIRDITNYESPLVTYLYEPGSTMKTYTYMCAIEKGTYDGSATYESGSIEVEGTKISDWNGGRGWGTVTYDKGYEYSSNVAITNILQKFIDKDDLKSCLESYGFGSYTNIELPREMLGNIEFNYPVEVAAAGFGQGITTTAIQHLRALSMISNEGRMLSPHIVDKIIDPNTGKTIYESKTEQSDQVVSVSTVNKIRELMYNTVNGTDVGTTGSAYKTDSTVVIGKTGTAQIYDNETGGYLKDSNGYIYSFSGMFPASDPQYIIYAAIKRPNVGSSSVLAKQVKSVIENIVKYRNLQDDTGKNTNVKSLTVESYKNKKIDEVIQSLEDYKLNIIKMGSGDYIIDQYPLKGEKIISGDKFFIKTNSDTYTMPSIIGWSKKDVQTLCNMLSISCTFNGYGYVTSQGINEGTTLNNDLKLDVALSDKKSIIEAN